MDVGARIVELRKKIGLSQYALQKRTGISQGSLSQYEAGLKIPGTDTIERICDGLGISMAEFFEINTDESMQRIALDDRERNLVACYRVLTESQKKDILTVLNVLADQSGDE